MTEAFSGHGCFNAYLRRFKKRVEATCCYCDSLVDNAQHALFISAKWSVAKESIDQVVGAELTPETMVLLMLQSRLARLVG